MQEEKPKRNYKREYENEKKSVQILSVRLSKEVFEDFTAKCDMNGTTKNAVLKKFIEEYTYGNNKN